MTGNNGLTKHIFFNGLLALLFLGTLNSAKAQEGYNIIWITVEDLSPRIGAYGDELAKTPNIDQLAKEGVRYTNAYTTYGVCAPNRHTLITGMYPTSTGAMAMRTWKRTSALDKITDPELLNIPVYEATPPAGVKCFSEYFRAAGYYCTNNSKEDYQFKTPITAWDESGSDAHWRNRPDKDMPFFAVFNSMATHESQIFKAYYPKITDPLHVVVPPYYPDTPTVRADIARYYDNVHAMDRWVGELIGQLKEDGLYDKTIILFFTDHGDGLPRAKRWVYDSGIKVPLIIRYPNGKGKGTTEDKLVSFVDFAPTTMGLAKLKIPEYMEGYDFLDNKIKEREYVYAFRDRMDPAPETIRAVRNDRYKYIRNYRPDLPYIGFIPYRDKARIMQEILQLKEAKRLGPDQWQFWSEKKPLEELYDIRNDPYEINNLASNPQYFEKLATLRTAQEEFGKNYGDLGMMPESELIKRLWPPDGKQPQVEKPSVNRTPKGLVLETATARASIAYRYDKGNWKLYTAPLKKTRNKKIEVIACSIGWKPSLITTKKL
ncbi:MAG: sulfatase [Flavobacteriaceae bacterium]